MAVRDPEALTKSYEEAMAKFIAQMPAAKRQALITEVLEGLSVEQIAQALEAAATKLSPAQWDALKKKLT
jgi:DNA-directed RNA polymerase specialized sigma24 family protein